MARAIQQKAGVSTRTSKKDLFVDKGDGGWGLKSFVDEQRLVLPCSMLKFSLNSTEMTSKISGEQAFEDVSYSMVNATGYLKQTYCVNIEDRTKVNPRELLQWVSRKLQTTAQKTEHTIYR